MPDAGTKNSSLLNKLNVSKWKDYGWGYLFVAPTIIGCVVLYLWPIAQTLYLSLTNAVGFAAPVWIGLKNFQRLFTDTAVLGATINTIVYTIIAVPIGCALSFLIAVLLNTSIRGKSIYRVIYFLPVVSTPAAIAMVWKWLYNYDYGIINYCLSLIGIDKINWIADPKYALASVIIVGIWSGLGYNMVILLAGLQEIPAVYYEAAEIDGAGSFLKMIKITLPLVSPTMFFVVITSMINSLQVFDSIYMILDYSPALGSAQSLVFLFYKYTFWMNDKGYGSCIAVVLLAIILIVTLIQMRMQKKWVHYDD